MNKTPKGLKQCPACGEYKGMTKRKRLNWEGHPLQEVYKLSNDYVVFSCICDGRTCQRCKSTLMRKPGSNEYDIETNSLWHTPGFTIMKPCEKCRNIL